MSKFIGDVSAYAYAVSKGYTGTEEEFAELMASYADVGQTAVDAAESALDSKTAAQTAASTATTKASEASQSASAAHTDAESADQSASQASTSAQTASTKASEASQSASTATEKATEATTAASNATTAKDDAVTAKNAAQTAQGKAETAQEAAEDAAESVSASAAQIQTNKEDIIELKSNLSYLGNWAFLTKGAEDKAVAFSIKQGHTYTVTNTSESGGLTFALRETPTGSDLQTVYNLNAGTTHDFTANQDANYIAGWQASAQTFFIIDKASKTEEWDTYQNKIDDVNALKLSVTITAGGFDETDGTITQNPYYSYTDFIDISQFGMLRVVSPNGPLNYCTWYKEDKTTGIRFVVAQGDNTLYAPAGYKYARLSAGTSTITGISIYTGLWFNGAIARTYIEGIKDSLPNRFTAIRTTDGVTDFFEYKVVKGHSYLLINPNDFACSFVPKKPDGTVPSIGSTTITAKSVNMRVAEFDGIANVYFAGDNGTLYIYDMDGESVRKTITDLNQEACDAIVSSRYKTSADPHLLSLIHFSDIHGDHTALRRLINFKSDMTKFIDDAICTGDIISSKFGDSLDFWTTSEGSEYILSCVGNHDSYYTNSMDSAQMVPMSDVADKFIAPFEDNWGTIVRPSGCSYYYKDFISGYRLIVLDSVRIGDEATAQKTWLENALTDAKTNNLAVIIAMHYMPTGAMHILDCQFSKYGSFGDSGYICNAPAFPVEESVQAFIDGGGIFMCYLIGHLHRDIFGYVYGYPDQLCIMATTASANRAELEVNADLGRTIGTKMQDAFNVVTFDKDNHMIKVVRVGADIDNVMRPRKAVSYSTATKLFIRN